MMDDTTREMFAHYNARSYAKPRSMPEVTARYNLKRQQYQDLRKMDAPNHEQLSMLYAEAKVLGWVLGKEEKTVIRELNS